MDINKRILEIDQDQLDEISQICIEKDIEDGHTNTKTVSNSNIIAPQIWFGKSYSAHKIRPIQNENLDKKPEGGLWTSSYIQFHEKPFDRIRYISDWHTKGDNMGIVYENLDQSEIWVLFPKNDLSILTIDSYDDLLQAIERYEYIEKNPKLKLRYEWLRCLNFERIFNDYDTVHLTERGQQETCHSEINLRGWDCECYLWGNHEFSDYYMLSQMNKMVIVSELKTNKSQFNIFSRK